MDKTISLKKNYVMNMILTVSAFLFPLITFPYASRVLGPEGLGKVGLATSWIAYFDLFAQLGVPTYGIRACAKLRDDREALTRTVHELLTINIITSAISYVALFVLLFLNPRIAAEKPLYLIVSITIILNAIGMEWLYKGLEQYTYITKRSLVFKVIALVFLFLLVRSSSDYVIYGGVSIFAASASNIFNFFRARRFIDLAPVGGYHYRRHLRPIGIFFAMTCATTIYTNLDIVMLGHMKTDTDVGYYSAAVKIKNVMVTIVTSLGTVLLPRASYYVKHQMRDEFVRLTRKAISFICFSAIPVALFLLLFAREGILLLSGDAYVPAIAPMQIIMPTIVLIGLTNFLGIEILVPLGREKSVLWSVVAGAVVDVILNAILIPRYAASGAAIGTLCAEAVVLVIQSRMLRGDIRSYFGDVHAFSLIVALLPAGAAGLAVSHFLHTGLQGRLSDLVTLLVAALFFFGIYVVILLARGEPLMREILSIIRSTFRRLLKRG